MTPTKLLFCATICLLGICLAPVTAFQALRPTVGTAAQSHATKIPTRIHVAADQIVDAADKVVEVGKVIAPNAQALLDAGAHTAKTAAELLPSDASPELQKAVDTAIQYGQAVEQGHANFLPGVAETHSWFQPLADPAVFDSPEAVQTHLQQDMRLYRIFERLPLVAVVYAVIEFYFFRPSSDLTREEIEDDPARVVSETAVEVAIRIFALGCCALFTMYSVQ